MKLFKNKASDFYSIIKKNIYKYFQKQIFIIWEIVLQIFSKITTCIKNTETFHISGTVIHIRTPLLQCKYGLIRGVASLDGFNSLGIYSLSASKIWPDKRGGFSRGEQFSSILLSHCSILLSQCI